MDTLEEIKLGMAKAFFATAWADAAESAGVSLAGKEILDVMPKDIDPAALHAAKTLECDLVRVHDRPVADLYFKNQAGLNPEDWGHYVAMQSMGQGVGLQDYGVTLYVPYGEFGQHSLQIDYF